MISFRKIKFIFIFFIFFSITLVAQETNIGKKNEENTDAKPNLNQKNNFYKLSKNNNNIFKNAVKEYIVYNKGIQDFYNVLDFEKNWLNKIIQTENSWHKQLLKLEQNYRKSFQKLVGLKTGQNDVAIRIENFTKNINKINKDIDEIRRQIVQINVDQQVFINGLQNTPLSTLVAIETIFTPDLIKIKDKLKPLNKTIFKGLEDPVLAHLSRKYSNKIDIPFKTGKVSISYLYPENITLFDAKANEVVYLFLKVEGYPFSNSNGPSDNLINQEMDIQIFSEKEQLKSYLNSKSVGDKRLLDWLEKEYNIQEVKNEFFLDNIKNKLNDFSMFKKGLNQNISDLEIKVSEITTKKDQTIEKSGVQSIEKEYKKAKELYINFFSKRQVLTHEKYTLENGVMFDALHVESPSKNTIEKLNTKNVANINVNGRPLKEIFSDIIWIAHKKPKINLQNYRERIYRPNEDNNQLIQGELEWEIEDEEFSILKLTKGNVGSRSHFVVDLAKRTYLKSIPGFPSEKSGTCKASLLFKRGKDIMRDSQKPILKKLVKCLKKYPQQMIRITGHTDPLKPNYGEGSKYSNVMLGLKRAEKMVLALTKLKFNPGRFIVVSRGAQMPVAIGKSNKELQKNRRVEIISKPSF